MDQEESVDEHVAQCREQGDGVGSRPSDWRREAPDCHDPVRGREADRGFLERQTHAASREEKNAPLNGKTEEDLCVGRHLCAQRRGDHAPYLSREHAKP